MRGEGKEKGAGAMLLREYLFTYHRAGKAFNIWFGDYFPEGAAL